MMMIMKITIIIIKTLKGEKTEVARVKYMGDHVILSAKGNDRALDFSFGPSTEEMQQLAETQDMNVISFEMAEGFNGPYVGMYATSNGKASKKTVRFDWFKYEGK